MVESQPSKLLVASSILVSRSIPHESKSPRNEPRPKETVNRNSFMLISIELDSDEEGAWKALGQRRFEAVYAPEDSVYDQSIDEAPTR